MPSPQCKVVAGPTVPNGTGTSQAAAGIQFFKQTAAYQSLPFCWAGVGAGGPRCTRSPLTRVATFCLHGVSGARSPCGAASAPTSLLYRSCFNRLAGQEGGGERSREKFLTDQCRRTAHHEEASPAAAEVIP